MCWNSSRQLTCTTEAPRAARNFSSGVISLRLGQALWVESLTDDTRLVASELVTNALNAGCTKLELTVTVHRSRIRLSVADNAPGLPRAVAAGPDDTTGRGLALTAALALEFGFGLAPIGKEVWADLPVEIDQFAPDALSWCDEPPGAGRVVTLRPDRDD
jgi:signal transduction histidine kinase